MIEAGLVYIHSEQASSGFAGCGALVEGPFVVTCRHVWDQALQAAGGGPVLVCFPPPQGSGEPVFSEATLADGCDAGARPPDLVILEAAVPPASAALSVARGGGVAETGPAAALAVLYGRAPDMQILELTIAGTIMSRIAPSGLRQFTGGGSGYWFDRGSSGSPLGLSDGTTLAGMLCMSETGDQPGDPAIREAFLLPASTIHRFLCAHVGRLVAQRRNVDPAKMPEILDRLGAPDLPLDKLRSRLEFFFDNVEALAAEPEAAPRPDALPPETDSPADGAARVLSALSRSRALSARFEPAAAMAVLDQALAEEARIRRQRLLPLLAEKLRQQRLVLDYQGAIASLAEITTLDPDASWGWIGLGDTRRRIGSREAALDAYRMGLRAADRAGNQRDRSICQQHIGDLLVVEGDRAGALAAYHACLAIARQLLDADPGNDEHRYDLAVSHIRIGGMLHAEGESAAALDAYRACLAVLQPLALDQPGQVAWQQDLSVTHECIGDLLLARGGRSDALAAYRASLAIREALVATDPANTGWQQNLATAHQRISDLLRRAGDLSGALAEARACLAIAQRVAEHDADAAHFQRELSVSHNIVGFILTRQDDFSGALEEYNAGLAIIQRLCARDPGQTGWQGDLSTSHERIGGVLLARGDLQASLAAFQASLAIRRMLCTRDPGNAGWQRELAVSHNKVGDTLREQAMLDQAAGNAQHGQRNMEAALDSFRTALAISEPLVVRDPDNAEWQRDLSVSHNKVGEILQLQGKAATALESFRTALGIAERLAARDPGNADWQRDLIVAYVRTSSADPAGPRAWLARALAVATGLAAEGRLAPADSWMIPDLARRLAALPPDTGDTKAG